MELVPTPEQSDPELIQFKDRLTTSLQDVLDFFPGDDFLVLQPINLDVEGDTRSLEELSTEERLALGNIITETLKIDLENQESIIDTYEFEGPLREDETPSTVKVSVYVTNREELFLHKIIYENGDIVYAVGPQDMQIQ